MPQFRRPSGAEADAGEGAGPDGQVSFGGTRARVARLNERTKEREMLKALAVGTLAAVAVVAAAANAAAQPKDIVQTAVAAGSFTTLAKALAGGGPGGHAERTRALHGVRADR